MRTIPSRTAWPICPRAPCKAYIAHAWPSPSVNIRQHPFYWPVLAPFHHARWLVVALRSGYWPLLGTGAVGNSVLAVSDRSDLILTVCTRELNVQRLHIRIQNANPTVRTRKHEVVSCSVAGSNRLFPSKIASPLLPRKSARRLPVSRQVLKETTCS